MGNSMRTKKMSELFTPEEMQLFRLCIPFKDLENNTYNENYVWTKEKMYEIVTNEIEDYKKFIKETKENLKNITDKKTVDVLTDLVDKSSNNIQDMEDLRHKIAYLIV